MLGSIFKSAGVLLNSVRVKTDQWKVSKAESKQLLLNERRIADDQRVAKELRKTDGQLSAEERRIAAKKSANGYISPEAFEAKQVA